MTVFHLGEMFSGPGGIAVGADEASRKNLEATDGSGSSIRHSWAIDYDRDTTRTYARNIQIAEKDVHCADVREFDVTQVPDFNAFAFGFPCNDFSTAGEGRGLDGSFGSLYTYGLQAIAAREPDWFLAENVTGLSHANGGRAFGRILDGLHKPVEHLHRIGMDVPLGPGGSEASEDLTYHLVAHRYHFEEYGVPQKRHRILIVGVRSDLADKGIRFRVPRPTHLSPEQWVTAETALADLADENGLAHNHAPRQPSERVQRRLALIPPGGNAFDTDFSDDPDLRLNVRGLTLSSIYRRLKKDEPAYTVTGSGGGGTHMYHWDLLRALTNRERAKLQTFPNDFVFEGGSTSVRRQVGMAVPPRGAEVIIRAILEAFDDAPSRGPSVEANIDVDRLIRGFRDSKGLPHDGQAALPFD